MINKQELKSRLKWIFATLFGWMIIIPLTGKIVEVSPIKDTMWIGIIGLIIILLLDN